MTMLLKADRAGRGVWFITKYCTAKCGYVICCRAFLAFSLRAVRSKDEHSGVVCVRIRTSSLTPPDM